jgi:hypothetical protein
VDFSILDKDLRNEMARERDKVATDLAAVLRIRDVYPGSNFSIPDPGLRRHWIRSATEIFFLPKKLLLSSLK